MIEWILLIVGTIALGTIAYFVDKMEEEENRVWCDSMRKLLEEKTHDKQI